MPLTWLRHYCKWVRNSGKRQNGPERDDMKTVGLILAVVVLILGVPVSSIRAGADQSGRFVAGHVPQKAYYIEISISRCRLTLYEKDAQGEKVPVAEYRVGTAVRGLEVYPTGPGKVIRIEFDPSWHPTEYTRSIYAQKGITLPEVVPPGDSRNYMGTFKIYLSHSTTHGSIYRIHGNNNPMRIGRRVTGGCICMDNEEGRALAKTISVGTEVNIVM